MKKVLKIIGYFFGGILVIALIAGLSAFFFTRGMPDTMDEFFAHTKGGNYEAAYEMTSSGFQSATSLEKFKDLLPKYGLIDVESSSWGGRYISSEGLAEISGTIVTGQYGEVPMKVQFVKEEKEWRIQFFEVDLMDSTGKKPTMSVPTEEALLKLANDANRLLFAAINDRDFTKMYEDISDFWKKQTTAEELQNAFGGFIESDRTFDYIFEKDPIFTQDAVVDPETGVLVLRGRYYGDEVSMSFETKYLYEGSDWKLVGINVQEL